MCSGAAAVCVCVCARVHQAVVKWAQFGVLACVPFLDQNATQLLHRGIRSSWRHFLSLLFSSFQATLVASSRVSFSIFSCPHSFVHFSVYIPTVWLSCALSLTFLFFCLSFFFHLLEKLTGLSEFQGQALPSLFTNPETHESFLFMIRQASE